MMAITTTITGSGTQTKTIEGSECSPVWVGEFQKQSISFSAVNILLSITATLGNSLILVALHKESSLHPPSKLLYRCLATTDLLVGAVSHPLYATYWISVVNEHWSLCRYAWVTNGVTSYALCSLSMSTLTAISVDRLLALLLGLRYREIVTLRRTYRLCCMCSHWFILSFQLPYNLLVQSYRATIMPSYLNRLVYKDFLRSQSSSGSSTRFCSTTAEPTKCTEHGAIQKGTAECTLGAVSFGCLLCTTINSGNFDLSSQRAISESHHI